MTGILRTKRFIYLTMKSNNIADKLYRILINLGDRTTFIEKFGDKNTDYITIVHSN